jgi:hypothetical protein
MILMRTLRSCGVFRSATARQRAIPCRDRGAPGRKAPQTHGLAARARDVMPPLTDQGPARDGKYCEFVSLPGRFARK